MIETLSVPVPPIDDCWNRIGIHGDQSCAKLATYIHCRNCEVYARGAADLLDRLPRAAEDDADVAVGSMGGDIDVGGLDLASIQRDKQAFSSSTGEPLLVVRIGSEWLGLPARHVAQIAETGAVHSLPRLRSKAVLGLVNIRGQLTVCVSLARLLDLQERPDSPESAVPSTLTSARSVHAPLARFLVGQDRSDEPCTVFPVDEVYGIARFKREHYRPVPATLSHASASHTRAIADWRDGTLGVLDGDKLFETLRRSLG
ncbi:chemotaxis protein CheW [Robbsia andropogonis]|uniref:chemotaxis protein CheW n=1 Tax=Robbsia andropogonis TaxID=28092 RepID=UPI00209DCD22|nr:chemotaxis protein CheW [Robbsia andropogonis]MCP1119458.1 chemotaxis protein CheW [Robbsia andropogonis]MCP1129441.1 chemotaxis protein CheW [Robbsia andropogonis]